MRARLRIAGSRRPHQVDRRVERGDAVFGDQIRVGAAIEQHAGQIELTVHRGDEQRRGVVAAFALIHVDARVQQRRGDVDVALAGGVEKRRHAALPRHLLVEHVLALEARRQHARRRRTPGFGLDGEVAPIRVLTVAAQRA